MMNFEQKKKGVYSHVSHQEIWGSKTGCRSKQRSVRGIINGDIASEVFIEKPRNKRQMIMEEAGKWFLLDCKILMDFGKMNN